MARKNSNKLKARVIEYRREKIKSLRNDYTRINYPYVSINSNEINELVCLRHASSYKRYYQIGEEVEVFWYKGKLVPWN